jgi:ribosome maturation factor RimP
MTTAVESHIARLVAPTLEATGYELVRVKLVGGRHRQRLQVMAERADGGMSVDDCSKVSRLVSAVLDVEDPIQGAYDLEVSSPGIDRPLVRCADYERYVGHEAKIELRHAVDGRKRYRGRLLGTRDGAVVIAVGDGEVEIAFDDVAAAKLVLTDELIAASTQQEGE